MNLSELQKLSKTIGLKPLLISSNMVCEPINPAPPVTKMFFMDSESNAKIQID